MDKEREYSISKLFNVLLRHNPKKFNIELYGDYYCRISDLLKLEISFGEVIDFIDNHSNEYEYSLEEKWVRAKSGHSFILKECLKEVEPLDYMYISVEHNKEDSFIFSYYDMKYPSKGDNYCIFYNTYNDVIEAKKYLRNDIIIFKINTKQLKKDLNIKFFQLEKKRPKIKGHNKKIKTDKGDETIVVKQGWDIVEIEGEYDTVIESNPIHTLNEYIEDRYIFKK